jgi:hypothetical protein
MMRSEDTCMCRDVVATTVKLVPRRWHTWAPISDTGAISKATCINALSNLTISAGKVLVSPYKSL